MEKDKEKEKRETPIIDGDARPDMTIDPEPMNRRTPGKKKEEEAKNEVTSNRSGDVNNLEDYKDAN